MPNPEIKPVPRPLSDNIRTGTRLVIVVFDPTTLDLLILMLPIEEAIKPSKKHCMSSGNILK
jgi:hypothetical protein